MSDDHNQERLSQMVDDIRNCWDNNQTEAANILKYEIEKIVRDSWSDSNNCQAETSNDDSKKPE
jgi:hypothetical protein